MKLGMAGNGRRALRRTMWVGLGVGLTIGAISSNAPALVNPVTLIQRQVIKPNMLVVFDTSTSMFFAPGAKEYDASEVGMDCQDGVNCRQSGTGGRCYLAGTGAMGAGVKSDDTSCHNDAECRVGYCSNNIPSSCNQDSDCNTSGVTCRGYCSNNNANTCTKDSDCGSGNHCRGICSDDWSKSKCTSDADCTGDYFCAVFPNDICQASTSMSTALICQFGQNRCRTNADCGSGDTCGPASSRLAVAKRVVSNITAAYYNTVNFGLMTFYQTNYYPYFKVSGSVTTSTLTQFVTKDELAALGCWTKKDGPSATCPLNGQTYNRKASPESRYRVKTGKNSFTETDAAWCGPWCSVTGGIGYFRGANYTYSDPQGTLANASCSTAANCSAPDNACCDGTCCRTEPTYLGKKATFSNKDYIYWTPPPDRSNNGNFYAKIHGPRPIDAGDSGTQTLPCNATMGGRADSTVAPFMDTTDDAVKAKAMATAIMAKMEKTSQGGLTAEGFTPTGCTLSYNGVAAASYTNNALSYMQKVKSTDTMPCRNNYVLLVTDGNPTRTYDKTCDDPKCSAADPTAAGCPCWAVNAAQQLKTNGIKTYVVGFSNSVTGAYGVATMNNIAKAGGSDQAYFAVREDELTEAIVSAIYDAAKGNYSTSPASASSGVQQPSQVVQGTMLLDTRVDFPGWRGEVIGYETVSGSPQVAWSASTVSYDYRMRGKYAGKYFQPADSGTDAMGAYNYPDRSADWKKRNVWTSNGATMVKIDVNQATGAINNAATLFGLGLGISSTEADRIARWMLGDPSMGNPAVLGAIINSTPIDVGPPGLSHLPGGQEFYDAHLGRAYLTYVGASDGMLHAFFTNDVTIGSNNFKKGQEAYAYIPQTMLAVEAKLFSQGGQLPDPKDHIYGLANSAKVKSLCTANCDGASGTPTWKTELVMAYGFGGTEAIALDVTDPFDGNGPKSTTTAAPAPLMWSTQYLSPSTTSAYDNDLGLTTSVPAFYYAKGASKDDFRLMFGSYTVDQASGSMGKVVLSASAKNGSLFDALTITPPNSGCTQAFGLLSDVATARNFAHTEESQILAAYFGDTWGNLYRYVPSISGPNHYTGTTGNIGTVVSMSCNQPVHYVPAVAQLDRDNSYNRPGEIYLVQVTNSALDLDTKTFPASQMIIRRDLGTSDGSAVTTDTNWNPIILTAGPPGSPPPAPAVGGALCAKTNASSTCTTYLPALARPNATPLVILRTDGLGFDIISTWYLPPVNGCTDGVTYLNIYDVNVNGTYTLRFATDLASEPVTSVVFVGGKLMFAAQSGVTDLTSVLPASMKFHGGGAGVGGAAAERFRRLGWNELP